AGRKNAEHANHRPGRGQDRSKTEKSSQHPETSSKWNMWSAIQRAQHRKPPAVEHMGVDHGGLHVRVAEQLLNSANVLTCLQQMCGKGMAYRMWCRMLDQTSTPRRLTHRPLDGFLMQVMAINAVPARILRAIARRENELPSPLLHRIRILARQRERQISLAETFGQIPLMHMLHLVQMLP